MSPDPADDQAEIEETAYQKVPVPTAFTGDFDDVTKSADKGTAEDLAEAVEATAREEGRNLLPPSFVDLTMEPAPPPPGSLQPPGNFQRVSLSSSSAETSSSSEIADEEPPTAAMRALDAARAALAVIMSEGRDDAVEEAEAALAAAKRAVTEHMQPLD